MKICLIMAGGMAGGLAGHEFIHSGENFLAAVCFGTITVIWVVAERTRCQYKEVK